MSGFIDEADPNCTPHPCIDLAFGPTQNSGYWSSSSFAGAQVIAWFVNFYNGLVDNALKNNVYYARAVRGGR